MYLLAFHHPQASLRVQALDMLFRKLSLVSRLALRLRSRCCRYLHFLVIVIVIELELGLGLVLGLLQSRCCCSRLMTMMIRKRMSPLVRWLGIFFCLNCYQIGFALQALLTFRKLKSFFVVSFWLCDYVWSKSVFSYQSSWVLFLGILHPRRLQLRWLHRCFVCGRVHKRWYLASNSNQTCT